MKKKDLANLKGKKEGELVKLVDDKRKELVVTHAKVKAGQEKNLKKVKSLKKDVAQILTILRELNIKEEEEKKEKANQKQQAK